MLFLVAIAPSALAQPDTEQRPFLPPGPPPSLTSAQLEELVGGPTIVSFQGREVATTEAVKVLLTAAKIPTSPSSAIDTTEVPKKLTVNWNRMPFWKAAQEVETATGLRWAPLLGGSLGLLPVSYGELGNLNGRSAAQTPFVTITATSVSRFSSLTTQALGAKEDAPAVIVPSPNDAATLTLSLYFDPKLEVEGAGVRDLIIHTVEGTVSIPDSKTTPFDVRRLASRHCLFSCEWHPAHHHYLIVANLECARCQSGGEGYTNCGKFAVQRGSAGNCARPTEAARHGSKYSRTGWLHRLQFSPPLVGATRSRCSRPGVGS